MATVREKDSCDSIPESTLEVLPITPPPVVNSPPEKCDKSVNTDICWYGNNLFYLQNSLL